MADTLEIFGTEYTNVTGIIATNDNDTDLTYIRPQGTKSITANGAGIDVSEYASVDVTVPSSTPTLQTKTATYTPTESQQTATITADSGYDGLEEVDVTVGAISSTYVGSGITRRSSSDLSASGATVTAPSGYYASNATKTVTSGTATPASSISGTSATVSTGTNTLTLSKTVSNTPQVSAGYVSSGTAGNSSVSLTASVTTKAAATITPTTSNQTIASGTYLTGTQTIAGDANLVAGNIKQGVTIFNVAGSYSGGGGMNIQAYYGSDSVATTAYTATDVSITVATSGTYTVTWTGWRNTNSGTSGSQLYRTRNGIDTSIGNAVTTFTGTYGQVVTLTGQQFQQGDILTVRARARNTSYAMYVANLIIEQTA